MADIKIYGTLKNVTNEPIARAEQIGDLSKVATSGSYNDLKDKPIFTYKSDIIRDDSNVIKTIYGGSHIVFTNAGNPGSIHDHIIDLSLPPLT